MDLLAADDMAVTNRLLAHAKRLLVRRGHATAIGDTYEGHGFKINLKCSGRWAHVKIVRDGALVAQMRWSGHKPGRAFVAPGPWRAELLAVPADHA